MTGNNFDLGYPPQYFQLSKMINLVLKKMCNFEKNFSHGKIHF